MKMQIIPEIVTKQLIVTLETTARVHEAVQAMSNQNVAAICIVDMDQKLVGIVSERDLTHRVLACGLSPQTTRVADIMSKNPDALRAEDSALDAIELMLGRNIRHLPVVDGDNKVLAMVSIRDLLKGALRSLDVELSVEAQAAFSPITAYPLATN
jgi:CBS domain-containing protein